MKTTKLFLVLSALFLFFNGCKNPSFKNDAEIKFLAQEIDFGKLKVGEVKNCTFEFDNPGKSHLIIKAVKPSCGCTNPIWPDKPIKPGENGKIGVKYVANDDGVFIQYITVIYNGYNSPVTLIIKGEVQSL